MDSKEKHRYDQWANQHQDKVPAETLEQIWTATGAYKEDYSPDVEAGLDRFQQRIKSEAGAKTVSIRSRLVRLAAAAALLVAAVLGIRHFLSIPAAPMAFQSDEGELRDLLLDDGSSITLNSSSQLSVNQFFGRDDRRVELVGEAFFEVTPNKSKPFVVKTQVGEVKVLGTSFNIKAYPGSGLFEVFVKTGKVSVKLNESDKTQVLVPGQFLRFEQATGHISLEDDLAGAAISWKTGQLTLKDKSIPEIMAAFEELYGVSFQLKTKQTTNCKQTLTMEKGKLAEALEVLQASCPTLLVEQVTNTEYLVKGSCCE